MVKRSLALTLLLVAVGCGEITTTSNPKARGALSAAPGAVRQRTSSSLRSLSGSGEIVAIEPGALTVTDVVTFDELGGESLNHDGILNAVGATFAERFAGQEVSTFQNDFGEQFDVLSGSPSSPLRLQVGAPNQNVNTVFDPPSEAIVVDGLGPVGYPAFDAIGEGAIAMLFDVDQIELGFKIVGADGGMATVNFYRRDGSLIESMQVLLTSDETGQEYAFRRADGQRDIAGISIHNDDGGGIGYDDIKLNIPRGQTTQHVPAGEAATVTVKEDGKAVAGIDIPAGTFAEDVDVTVRFEELDPGETCHEYLLGQVGRCLEVKALRSSDGQKAELHQNVVIGLCLEAPEPLEFFKFEDRRGRALPLQEVFVSFVDCEGFHYSSVKPSNWFEGLAMGLAKRVGNWVTPKSAYAADQGFGGEVHAEDGLSFFSWAAPVPMGQAGLVVNVLNSGRDAYAMKGTFDLLQGKNFDPFLGEVGFNPAVDEVVVAYGKKVQTIPVNAFRFSSFLQRYIYVGRAGVPGITGMEINPLTGAFVIAGISLTEGSTPPSTYRPFTVQIGHRIQGAALFCGTNGQCAPQHH